MPTIGKLDSAISVNQYRPQFLNGLQNMLSTSVDTFSGNLHATSEWTGLWWRWLSIRRVYVERVTLIGSNVDTALAVPSIRELTVEECTNSILLHLVDSCPVLRSLTLRWYYLKANEPHMTDSVFEKLVDLEEFNYDRRVFSYNVDSAVMEEFYDQSAAALVQMLHRCAKLKKVSLNGNTLWGMKLDELQPFGHLFYRLQFLGELSISSPPTGQAVSDLLTRCVNLREICYSGGMSEAADERSRLAMTALYQSCPLLEVVELKSFLSTSTLNAVISGLSRNCSLIHKLKLYNCKLSDSSLRDIAGMEALKDMSMFYCSGVMDAGMAVLATTRLTILSVHSHSLTAACLQSFVGSNISHTLESFELAIYKHMTPIDDVHVATALASCRNLKKLIMHMGHDACVFGRNGLDGLQAMATGCPSLTDLKVCLTATGLSYLGTHCANLKTCFAFNRCELGAPTSEGFPSIAELQTLYPAVEWRYNVREV
jgi:hypothetical protein